MTPITRIARAALAMAAVLHGVLLGSAHASSVTVPDQIPSIQAALDFTLSDTILVRPGLYPERPVIGREVVLRRLPQSPEEGMPLIAGLFIDYRFQHPGYRGPARIEECRFTRTVTIDIFWDPIDIFLTRCVLDSGIVDTSGRLGYREFISGCEIHGATSLRPRSVYADSNHFQGSLSLNVENFSITRNRFTGPAPFAIRGTAVSSGVIRQNQISDAGSGIELETEGRIEISGNVLRGCADGGIDASTYNWIDLVDNTIVDCGFGVIVDRAAIHAEGNRILGSRGNGMEITTISDCTLERNVIGRSGGHGMKVKCDFLYDINQNTIYLNGQHGLALAVDAGPPMRSGVNGNILYANDGIGMLLSVCCGEELAEPACNDVYANRGGDGRSVNDLSVDPMFCDLANDDVRLSSASPLLSAEVCGQIGALGESCDASTATLVTLFTAARVPDGIELRWQVANDSGAAPVLWLERARWAAGPWERVDSERRVEGQVTVELDRNAVRGQRHWYRLMAQEGGQARSLGTVEVEPDVPGGFMLRRVSPNPGSGALRIEFVVAVPAQIEIGVFDLQGRFIAKLARGLWPAGLHHIEWNGQTRSGAATPGVYLVRYRFPGGHEYQRIVRSS